MGGAKTGANYAASLYAAEEAKHAGFTQVLWLDGAHRKYIDEVGTMNIMVKIGDEIITPPLDGTILAGVTRDSVLTLMREWGLRVRAPGRHRRGHRGAHKGKLEGSVGHRHRRRHLAGGRAVLQGRADRDQRRQHRPAHPEALRHDRGHPVRHARPTRTAGRSRSRREQSEAEHDRLRLLEDPRRAIPSVKVDEDERTLGFMDINPLNPGIAW